MKIIDTEVLFALNPKDYKHKYVINLFKREKDIFVPDTALFEFQVVLRSRGRSVSQIRNALIALNQILSDNNINLVNTFSTNMFILQCELEEKYNLSYFDSLIAASALILDSQIISDDNDFDQINGLERIPLSY